MDAPGSGERNVDSGLQVDYSWRTMEAAAEDRAGWVELRGLWAVTH